MRRCGRTISIAGFRRISVLLVSVIMPALLCGCALVQIVTGDLPDDEAVLTYRISRTTDPGYLSDLHLHRARLRLKANAPVHEYRGVLGDLQKALQFKPDRRDADEIRAWIAVLERLSALEKEIAQLKARNEQAEKREQALKKTIEELQSLEIEMEQRRQLFR